MIPFEPRMFGWHLSNYQFRSGLGRAHVDLKLDLGYDLGVGGTTSFVAIFRLIELIPIGRRNLGLNDALEKSGFFSTLAPLGSLKATRQFF